MNALIAFFLGQFSIVVLIFSFIYLFIFGEEPETLHASKTRKRRQSHGLLSPRLRRQRSTLLRPEPPIAPGTILAKTYYNVRGHQPESLDWFNVLVAQTLAQLRTEALHDDALLKSLSEVLNGPGKPDFVGDISVTELALGEEFPIFSNCRIIPVDEAGVEVKSVVHGTRLLARLDMDLSDAITLGVETKLLLNYPKPLVAVLPVALAVSVVRFSGTLSLSFSPSVSEESETVLPPGPTTLSFSFLPDYRLDLSVRSLLGSRSRLQDIPKIAQLVEARIHAWLEDRCVEPRYQQIVLPSIWPRKKNTRGMEHDEEGDETAVEDKDAEGESSTPGADKDAQNSTETPPGPSGERYKEGSLEAQMAEEGKKLRAAEGRSLPSDQEVRKRNPVLRRMNNQSTENLRIPGQFNE